MTTRELIDQVDIVAVWAGLGGGPLRRNRGCAWWRESTSWSVSLSTEKQAFYDFSPGKGGGVLALVQMARNCDRRAALEWLAAFYNISLDDRPFSIAERRAWQRKRSKAEARAADLTAWRESALKAIRERRNNLISDELTVCRWGLHALKHGAAEDDWQFAWEVIAETLDIKRLDRWVCCLEAMPPTEVINLRERMEAVAV